MCLASNIVNANTKQDLPLLPSLVETAGNGLAIVEEQPRLLHQSSENSTKQETNSRASLSRRTKSKKHFVNHNYHDHCPGHKKPGESCSNIIVSDEQETDATQGHTLHHQGGPRGGVAVPFPIKLHLMLSQAKAESFDHVVSWQPHGRSFKVHQPKRFVAEVMPRWFKQSKLTSFQRQLNLYGFARLTTGRDRGAYYHELFLRGHFGLCRRMVRTCVKGTGIKPAASPSTEPNFYKMEQCISECCAAEQEQIALCLANIQAIDNSLADTTLSILTTSLGTEDIWPMTTGQANSVADSQTIIQTGKRVESLSFGPLSPESAVLDVDASLADVGKFSTPRCLTPSLFPISDDSFDETDDEMLFEGHPFYRLDPALLGW